MHFRLITTFALSLLILSAVGCATGKLAYRIDPEINNLQNLSGYASLISVSVVDNRKLDHERLSDSTQFISGPENIAEILRTKMIERLKNNQFKIINNPLLADLAIEIDINQLDVAVTGSLLKSEIRVSNKLHLKANKQSNVFEKIFQMNRTQEVANPVLESDLSGVVNKILSEQLSTIFADPELLKLAKG